MQDEDLPKPFKPKPLDDDESASASPKSGDTIYSSGLPPGDEDDDSPSGGSNASDTFGSKPWSAGRLDGADTDDDQQTPDIDVSRLGMELAKAMSVKEQGYHPVVIFGTNNSGKTALLMSLFSILRNEADRLKAGLVLCEPLLDDNTETGGLLYEEAQHTFEIKTKAFMRREKIPVTRFELPFFIPVELRPQKEENIRFAFMESNGEWYRPLVEPGAELTGVKKLYPAMRKEIEQFVGEFRGGISFIFIAPATQERVHGPARIGRDIDRLESASEALVGVLKSYERIRKFSREKDRFVTLITKWDARKRGEQTNAPIDDPEFLAQDEGAAYQFFKEYYNEAYSELQGLPVSEKHWRIQAYISGVMDENGLLPLEQGSDQKDVVDSYPEEMWIWLYKHALETRKKTPVSPFPRPPRRPALIRFFEKALDALSGG